MCLFVCVTVCTYVNMKMTVLNLLLGDLSSDPNVTANKFKMLFVARLVSDDNYLGFVLPFVCSIEL